jgi:hypothetical protein
MRKTLKNHFVCPFAASFFFLFITSWAMATYPVKINDAANNNNHRLASTASPSLARTDLRNFSFGAVGDWGCSPNANKTVSNIIDKKPDLVLGLGDYSYRDTADCWFQIASPIINKKTTIMKISLGNHEVDSFYKLNQFINHFNFTKPYYSFDLHNVHFIAISSFHWNLMIQWVLSSTNSYIVTFPKQRLIPILTGL